MSPLNPVQFYKCLSDETRLRCLMLIQHEEELCVCELTAALQEIQPKISRHLSQLRAHELLLDRRQGQWIFYRINPDLPDWAKSVLGVTLQDKPSLIKDNLKSLQRMGTRPERVKACC